MWLSRFKNPISIHEDVGSTPVPAQWAKDLVFPWLWWRPQLQFQFDTWPRNFHMQQVQPSKKKKKERKKKSQAWNPGFAISELWVLGQVT